ncbi:MAG: ATP-binding cassette domain-containing protein, partial [Rhodothermales bacterium]|nr:ATP-binding cassette domain-containing protein [Rhodothermales bacterium]
SLPIIGLYAFAGIRLFPATQTIYQNIARMRVGKPALDALYEDLNQQPQEAARIAESVRHLDQTPLLENALELRNISFRYPDSEWTAINGLSLRIDARTTVAFVGRTGSGKTTLSDIVLGLLHPVEGQVIVDGKEIGPENLRHWQSRIGYVPQDIFLSDDTVRNNIAFGLPDGEIDQEAVERAARLAELHDFVVSALPKGYDTMVGERGIRLSGGQRQRIGIARALFGDPDLLVLDEATSALDNMTERAVMDAVHNLARKKTIIMVAHRLSTVRDCDVIFLIEGGQLKAKGRYEELVEMSDQFRSMVYD